MIMLWNDGYLQQEGVGAAVACPPNRTGRLGRLCSCLPMNPHSEPHAPRAGRAYLPSHRSAEAAHPHLHLGAADFRSAPPHAWICLVMNAPGLPDACCQRGPCCCKQSISQPPATALLMTSTSAQSCLHTMLDISASGPAATLWAGSILEFDGCFGSAPPPGIQQRSCSLRWVSSRQHKVHCNTKCSRLDVGTRTRREMRNFRASGC